jgi:hypothetical protein
MSEGEASDFPRSGPKNGTIFSGSGNSSIGQAIWDLQRGIKLSMPLSRAMPSVSAGVEEFEHKRRRGHLSGVLLRSQQRRCTYFSCLLEEGAKNAAIGDRNWQAQIPGVDP